MTGQKENTYQRNAFEALCQVASDNEYCWKLSCTTCGHGDFRVGFAKLIRGFHPDTDVFWTHGKRPSMLYEEKEIYQNFFKAEADLEDQTALADLVSKSDLKEISLKCKYPDWLGYLGLVLYHCPNPKAVEILSKSLLPQFLEITEKSPDASRHFQYKIEHRELLSLEDLELLEKVLPSL